MSGALNMLGGLEVASKSGQAIAFGSRRSAEILVSIALADKGIQRAQLAARFWPETDELRARKALNNELWRLRESLKQSDAEPDAWIETHGEKIRLLEEDNGGPVVDTRKLIDLRQRLRKEAASAALLLTEEMTQLYAGDLTPEFDAGWVDDERRYLRSIYMDSLDEAVEIALKIQEQDTAQRLARMVLNIDPLQERAHRAIMRVYVSRGNRLEAVRHYDEFADKLLQEYDLEPDTVTTELYRQCRDSPAIKKKWQIVPVDDDSVSADMESQLVRLKALSAEISAIVTSLEHNFRTREGK